MVESLYCYSGGKLLECFLLGRKGNIDVVFVVGGFVMFFTYTYLSI